MDKEQVELTPKHFDSYDEAADFWETHDTTNYLDEFRTVELESELRACRFEVGFFCPTPPKGAFES